MALDGVLSAIVTPFTPDGERIDERALRRLIDQGISDGLHGFVPAGGTGEFSVLSHDERRRLIDIVTDQAAGRVPVLAHTGATSTREAIALSKHAQQAGATAVMTEWQAFVRNQVRLHGRNFAGPKLVCIDLQPYTTTQAPERSDILNVGGFSDAVFKVVAGFMADDGGRFVAEVEAVEL